MLVLSRKIGEKLIIGDNITVVVSRVAGNRVTLGIEAPHDVRDGVLEAGIEEDVAFGRGEEVRTHADRPDVVDIGEQMARRQRPTPGIEHSFHGVAVGRTGQCP